jgi:hypothetical protein
MVEVPPKKKSLIIRTIKETGEWVGRIDGQRVVLKKVTKNDPAHPDFLRIYYNFILKRKHQDGYADTVWAAIDTVAGLIGKGKYER